MKVKSQPDIAKPSKLAPDDDRAEKLVVCKDLDDILSEFTELSYNKTELLLRWKGFNGGCKCSRPVNIFRRKDKDSKNQSSSFRHL